MYGYSPRHQSEKNPVGRCLLLVPSDPFSHELCRKFQEKYRASKRRRGESPRQHKSQVLHTSTRIISTSYQQPSFGTMVDSAFMHLYVQLGSLLSECFLLNFLIFLIVCLRKYVSRNLRIQKLSRRQYLRKFVTKRQKCASSKVGFDQKLMEILSLFYWPTTHRAFVRGRTPLQRPTVPQTGRAKQDKHRCLYSSSTSNERTED